MIILVCFQWEAKAERGQEEFENISKMIRKEVERFEKGRVHDFKVSIIKYMESLLETQQQVSSSISLKISLEHLL